MHLVDADRRKTGGLVGTSLWQEAVAGVSPGPEGRS